MRRKEDIGREEKRRGWDGRRWKRGEGRRTEEESINKYM